jgi:hypothetical protein
MAVKFFRQPHPGGRGQRDLPIHPGRVAARVALRDLSHADQRVRPASQHHPLQIPDCLVVLCPRRLEDPLPQPPYVALMVAPGDGIPVRGCVRWSVHVEGRHRQRVCVSAHRCLTCPSVSAFWQGLRQRLTRPTSAHFRARHSPVSGQLCGTTVGGTACRPGFLFPFGCRRSLLGPSCPAKGLRLSRDRPTLHRGGRVLGPRRGFHVPHERDTGGFGCPLYSGATVLTQPTKTHQLPLSLLRD